jgi:arsenate reductase
MNEIGVGISSHRAKSIQELEGMSFDIVVTVCDAAKEACPAFPGASECIHRGFEDPAALEGTEQEVLAAYRRVRDEIKEWLEGKF